MVRSARKMPDGPRVSPDVDVHAILFGNLDIIAPDRERGRHDGAEDGVRAVERRLSVQVRLDLRRVAALSDDLADGGAGKLQPLGVHVHQRDRAVGQRGEGQQVAHESARESEAARPDEGDLLSHDISPRCYLTPLAGTTGSRMLLSPIQSASRCGQFLIVVSFERVPMLKA